tara:strand:- start:57 stop:257 length:201 start_codon:yes stop_codon:yes gene_type:complete
MKSLLLIVLLCSGCSQSLDKAMGIKYQSGHSYSYNLNGELICSPADSVGCSGFITEPDQMQVFNTE